jgi:hypothetical protein
LFDKALGTGKKKFIDEKAKGRDLPTRFRNPANGYEEDATGSWLWCFLFGPIYFALKGVWNHAVFSAGLAIVTCGLSWLMYPFFAREIVARNYLRKGWIAVTATPDSAASDLANRNE